jgi:trans-2,3-dihydro-3-hydroxyanthranilate isomerase
MSPDPALTLPLEFAVGGRGAVAHPYYVLDVFTDTALQGNQLGVFADGRAFSADQMQRLARELAFPETIFVLPPEAGGDARIRIFTPAAELPFAGHPTLGAAFAVGTALDRDAVTIETARGAIPVRLERRDGQVVFGWMDQPIRTWQPYERATELLAALGVARSTLPVEGYRNGPNHVFVVLDDEAAVAALTPDMAALARLEGIGANCVAGSGGRWKMRTFLPGLGIVEDPATGSAAGPLAIHLARHGRIAFGAEIVIRQGIEIGRPSVLHARAEGTAEKIDRVSVGGAAVIVARGEFHLAPSEAPDDAR